VALPDVGPRVLLELESGGGVGEVGTGDRRLRERYAAAGAAHLVQSTEPGSTVDLGRRP
jgi:hypothetical protein